MNRREMLRRVAMGAAAATTAAATSPTVHATLDVEPVPARWDYEPVMACGCDVSSMTISKALAALGWESGRGPKPLLCVHPEAYVYGLSSAEAFGGLVQVWATRELAKAEELRAPSPWGWEAADAWLIAWRGRRVGSEGA